MENMEFYEKYKTPPKNALKAFNNGKFKGTDINTMWRIKSLTEFFGMCGIGWYYEIKRLWTEETKAGDQFAFAEIELYVKVDGEWSKPISGNGGNKMTRVKTDGEVSTSDEAYKMAVTDALGVACRNLGMGADVYWENDRTKYTQTQTKESDEEKKEPAVLDEELLKEAKNFNIQLERVAGYFKVAITEITNDMLKTAIDMKKESLKK